MTPAPAERRWGGPVVLLALLLGLTFLLTWAWRALTSRPTLAVSYSNPVLSGDFPDPGVLPALGEFYAYATNGRGVNVRLAHSPDLVQWEMLGDALPTLGAWAEPGRTWAPEAAPGPRRGYLLYYTAREKGGARQCISVATSDTPRGPFIDTRDTPLVCHPDYGSIDPHPFIDEDGTRYLLWKDDGNRLGQRPALRIQRLDASGLTLVGAPVDLITADQPWEGGVVEAPTLIKRAGRYILLYSANDFTRASYAVGYATASSPLGPFVKAEAQPLLHAQGDVSGPGGQSIILDAVGQDWLLFHAWQAGHEGYPQGRRALHLERVVWGGDRPSVPGLLVEPEPAPLHRR